MAGALCIAVPCPHNGHPVAIRAIEPLDPAHRHAQTPAVLHPNHQFYEWWYFEVDFQDGNKTWRVISSFHFPHGLDPRRVLAHQRYHGNGVDYFTKYGDDPSQYAGIASYVVDVGATKNVALLISRLRPASIPTKVSLSRPGDPRVELQIGRSSFTQNPNGTYTLVVKQTGILFRPGQANRRLTLDMKVTFEQNTPGFQPPGAVLLDQTGVKHHWACVMPNPKVTIDKLVVKRAKRTSGTVTVCQARAGTTAIGGYHDHQWGHDLLYKQVLDWSWGRVSTGARGSALPHDKVLFFDVNGVSTPTIPASRPDPILVEVPGDGSEPRALQPTPGQQTFRLSGPQRVDFGDGCRLGIQGQRVPYFEHLRLRARTASASTRNYDIAHDLRHCVDVWPFYLRFLPRIVDHHTSRTLVGISEYMRADRLTLPDTQKIFALSEKMTYLE